MGVAEFSVVGDGVSSSGAPLIPEVPMEKPSIVALAERVDRLERENRLWRLGGGLALIVGLVVMLGGAQGIPDSKTVEAEQFILRDRNGRERAKLGLAADGAPALFLRGTDGNNRAILMVSEEDDSGSLYLFGGGQGLEGLSVVLHGGRRTANSPSLFLRRDDKTRINLNIDTAPGRPWLRFENEKGTLFQAPEPLVKPLTTLAPR
jgi:hypothetical protein